ncbi:MAG: hypothetical protein ACRC6M_15100 [Microcystaceae cyanobacterium]
MAPKPQIWHISPLIQITLLSLYLTLTVPLPFLARFNGVDLPLIVFGAAIALGFVFLLGFLSEQVAADAQQLQVNYPRWVFWLARRGWSLPWSEIQALKMRTTGQGGLVYYFTTKNGDRAYLLPMRVAGFNSLVQEIQAKTGLDTSDIRPLAQPWMYLILLVFTLFLALIDGWTITTAIHFTP